MLPSDRITPKNITWCKGVIVAPTKRIASEVKSRLGLHNWVATAPMSILRGGIRGFHSEPRILVVGDLMSEPAVLYNDIMTQLAPMFGGRQPIIYSIRNMLDD